MVLDGGMSRRAKRCTWKSPKAGLPQRVITAVCRSGAIKQGSDMGSMRARSKVEGLCRVSVLALQELC